MDNTLTDLLSKEDFQCHTMWDGRNDWEGGRLLFSDPVLRPRGGRNQDSSITWAAEPVTWKSNSQWNKRVVHN